MNEMMHAPAHEFTEDYGLWLAERAAHEAREHRAECLARALVHACGAVPPTQRLPTRESHEEHQASVRKFARKLADIRSRVPGYQPNAIFLGWLRTPGVTVAELEQELAHV